MKALRALLPYAGLCLPLIAPSRVPAIPPPACGNLDVSMAVKLDDSQHAIAQPEPGKALIYFIQDTGQAMNIAYPTTKIGIDGTWVGANKKDSWFAVAVDPGEHHLCAQIQSSFAPAESELAHLTVEAGNVYYFRTRIIFAERTAEYFSLAPVDSDEAAFMISSFPQATARVRKGTTTNGWRPN